MTSISSPLNFMGAFYLTRKQWYLAGDSRKIPSSLPTCISSHFLFPTEDFLVYDNNLNLTTGWGGVNESNKSDSAILIME